MATFQNQIGQDVLSPPARLQFLSIAEPDTGGQYSDGKYKATFLFSKTDTEFGPMKKVIEDLSQQAFGCSAKELDYLPFKDGDEKEWQGFPGSVYIVAKSKFPVDVWSPTKDATTGELYRVDAKKLYPGVIARAHFAPLAYMSGNKRGITFILNFIQYLEDAPRFGGIGQIDARDVLAEYVPGQAKKANGAVAAPEQETGAPENQEAAPRGRGRPPKTAEAAEPQGQETPSARAKRIAAENRAKDQAAAGNGEVADLPIAQPKTSGSSKSLMDMM